VIVALPARPTKEAFTLSDNDYMRFSQLLLNRCGLFFPERRRPEIELGVRHAFAASTCANLDEYYQLVQDPFANALDVDRLINAVTINETHFFRDTAQFDALYYHVLPDLIERKRSLRTLRIWSAGCASGEEPYSLAMLLRDLLPDVDEWAITILGTDINTEALARARQGIFGEWAFREERAKQWRARFFKPIGNRYELLPNVKRMVSLSRLNLVEPCYPAYETNTMFLDLILCRNVTIYFSEATTQQVIDRLYDALSVGSWLAVGHSEPSLFAYRRFQARNFKDTLIYQRTDQPTQLPTDWQQFMSSQSPIPPAPGKPPVAAPSKPLSLPVKPPTPTLPPPRSAPIERAAPQDLFERASELIEYGHSAEARLELLKLLTNRPNHAPALALLGQACANLGEWAAAEQWCRQALKLDNLFLSAYYTLALVLQHQSQFAEAIDAMKKVVYIDRTCALGHFGLADLYHAHGQLTPAFKSLDNARQLLERCADDQIIPMSGGITAGRLRETVIRQQQQWRAESEAPLCAIGQPEADRV
jgi:chemotaxis protein methyltransferase CheR